ncbi:unnamed protein product [Lupinus luteus]|uniref:Uncharacterized protein n=1 Tax=Lupinus luteus TaxID=3873 RepID=A0AAV1WI32_LUPLU
MELNEYPGPIHSSVLYDQDNHVSSAVWDGQVQWLPYKDMDLTAIPEGGKAPSRSLLKAIWVASNHPKRCATMGKGEPYSGSWGRFDGKNGLGSQHIVEGGRDIADEVEYTQWYQKITRKYIGRFASSLESEYQRTVNICLYIIAYLSLEYMLCIHGCYILLQVTAMREIANIADLVSTEGLGSYNRGLLDEVKNVVHKCLTEQLEEIPKDKTKKKCSRKRREKDGLACYRSHFDGVQLSLNRNIDGYFVPGE